MDGISIAEKKAARLKEWIIWLDEFIEDKPDIAFIPNAAELLNDYYWRLAVIFLKPLLEYSDDKEHNLHYYKIISSSEITVMAVMPIKYKGDDDLEARKQLNADLACFIALSILVNWRINGRKFIDEGKLEQTLYDCELIDMVEGQEKFYPLSIMDEHIAWLKDLNIASALPILSNSQTWRAIFLSSKIDA